MEKDLIKKPIAHINKENSIIKVISILRVFRFMDAAVFTCLPLMGIIVSVYQHHISQISIPSSLLYILVIYLLAIHVFLINDWADYYADRNDLHKGEESKQHLSVKHYLLIAIISGIIPVFLLLCFSTVKFIIGFILVLLSLMYSTNLFNLHGKSIPGFATLLHILGGMFAFLLGYLFFGDFNIHAVLAGIMCGVFLSAGHIFQEIQDFKGDRINKIITIANTIGKKPAALIGLTLIFCGHTLFQYLIYKEFLPDLSLINWMVFALCAVFILLSIKSGLDHRSIKLLRTKYRIIYAVFGIYIFIQIFIHYKSINHV